MIVDALVYAGPSLYRDGIGLDDLLAAAARAGVDHLLGAPARPPDYDLPAASERLAEECATSGGRASCLARVDPWQHDAPARARDLLTHGAVRGLLVHPYQETIQANHAAVVAVAREAAAAGKPVVVEAGHPLVAEALSLADLARQIDGPVVMTRGGQVNMGGLAQQSADLALAASANLHALTCGMYRQDWLEACVATFGPARLLHGSGAPIFDLAFELERTRQVAMSDTERADVLGGNARRLFGLTA